MLHAVLKVISVYIEILYETMCLTEYLDFPTLVCWKIKCCALNLNSKCLTASIVRPHHIRYANTSILYEDQLRCITVILVIS